MARPVYSTQIAIGSVFGGSSAVVTLPGPDTWVIRDMLLTPFIEVGNPIGIIAFLDSLEIIRWTLPSYFVGTLRWQGRQVAPGDSELALQLGPCTGNCQYVISGYALTTP